MKPRILVVGSANTDMIVRVDRIPRPGETVLGGAFSVAAGGKGANQAVGAARAGGAVTFVGCVGRDEFGGRALEGWTRLGIDVRHVRRDAKAPSGVALILVAESGENAIAVAGGANGRLTPADVRRARGAFGGADVLLLQLETPLGAVRTAARLASEAGALVLLNPAPARSLPDALLRRVDLITPNETEAELLTGIRLRSDAAVRRAAAVLRRRGVASVIITMGARGAYVATGLGDLWVPGFRVRAVDTTAAGDMFNGALAVALGEGRRLPEAVRFANAAAALSVTRMGAQPSAPSRGEIQRLLARRRSAASTACPWGRGLISPA
ncbi:MAG TPA: ribokinase [Verrucomicrobiota bacterium]|nr:ribokinase [Verrucomicrobiota bacterium]HNU50429.1 ribokinase [Verrucomicrobiota bacterium]